MTFYSPPEGARAVPDWLPTGFIEDENLGHLKTGKEAEVFVVERRSLDDDRRCLLALKRYRPLVVGKGELEASGFVKARTFVDDTIYHEGRRFRRSRDQRAVERMTDRGKRLLNDRWIGHEHDTMRQLWEAGASVPYPVEVIDDGMLMELIGDHTQAAPRLATARLDRIELNTAFGQLVDNLHIMTDAGIVHADLSPYNVLWWDGSITIIDIPQATDLFHNPSGFELLHRDVVRMCEWFLRKGHACDADEVFANVLP